LIPWSTLAEDDRPPDRLFGECRDRIEAGSQGEERLNLLAATQVLASLKFGKSSPLLEILGGSRIMIESPLLQEWGKRLEAMGEARGEARGLAVGEARGVANARREDIRRILGRRFGAVPPELSAALEAAEAGRLEALLDEAVTDASLEDFRRSLA
jgi:hypothetical protein